VVLCEEAQLLRQPMEIAEIKRRTFIRQSLGSLM